MLDHQFGKEPQLDLQVFLAAALGKLGGKIRFREEDLKFARGNVVWFLPNRSDPIQTGTIRVRLVPRWWAKPWKIGTNRFYESMAYLAVCLSRLGGEIVIAPDDLRFEAGRVGYLMTRQGEWITVALAHDRNHVTVVSGQCLRPREVVEARKILTPWHPMGA